MAHYITLRQLCMILPGKDGGPLPDRTGRNQAERARDEGRPIVWEGREYWPLKDGGNNWRFRVSVIQEE